MTVDRDRRLCQSRRVKVLRRIGLGNDLLAFLNSSMGAPRLVGSATRKDDA
jgi:hypothetical protein